MLWFIVALFLLPTISAQSPPYNATESILLNCGGPLESTDTNNRIWNSDRGSSYLQTTTSNASLTFSASTQIQSVIQTPYMTARIFRWQFNYTFPLLTGPKFLRLYFYPNNYSNFNTQQSFFSVTANGHTLLMNFSAFLNSPSPSNPSFFREYAINIGSDQRLDLTFTPNSGSFAFINGIEIVSMPNTLYFRGNSEKIYSVSTSRVEYLQNDTALQVLYRLNVGGGTVGNQADSGSNGMFRTWLQDDDYLTTVISSYDPIITFPINYTTDTPPYIAPQEVYKTMRTLGNDSRSINWTFPVDSGYNYFFRLHFCEFLLQITQQNQRVFSIIINNQTAIKDFDVIFVAGSPGIPIFQDYHVYVNNDGRNGRRNISLSVISFLEFHPQYLSAMLNGLEIFKMNSTTGSLAAANPDPNAPDSTTIRNAPAPTTMENAPAPSNNSVSSPLIYIVVGSVAGVLAVISFFIFGYRYCTKTTKLLEVIFHFNSKSTGNNKSSLPLSSDLCKHFSLNGLKSTTNNFDEKLLIGKGGFGNVYKGYIDSGKTPIAIKRLKTSSNQGVREFVTEIDMLSKLRHVHLVSLLGYCNENSEMILIYEYMLNGTLHEHLCKSQNSLLSWKKRLKICINAAKGLQYLHTSTSHTIIHRDVKSTNILLDEKWVAKISDFGLSRVGPTDEMDTHVTTMVKGSFGYMDPEYYMRQQLTNKSDVYSFGVVLFEVLCARPAILPGITPEEVNLAVWAKHCNAEGTIEELIDRNITDEINTECLNKFVETAIMCVSDRGIDRPTMSAVVSSLECAMQLQEAAEKNCAHGANANGSLNSSESNSSGLSTDNSPSWTHGEVFSELFNRDGR